MATTFLLWLCKLDLKKIFFRLHIQVIPCSIWLFISGLFHLEKCPQGPFMLSQIIEFLYFLWLNSIPVCVCAHTCARLVAQLCPTFCDPMDCSPPGSSVHRDSPGRNTGVGCHTLLQGIFPTQGWNPSLLNCRCILYTLSHVEKQPERLRDLASLLLSLTLPFQHEGMHKTPLFPVSGKHPSSKIQSRAEGAWRNWFKNCPPFHHPNPFS